MDKKYATTPLFLMALAAVALYFSYLIAQPFLSSVFLALMIAIVFHPVHARICARVRGRNTAALISTILVLMIVFVPAIALGFVVANEAQTLYQSLNTRLAEQGGWNPYVANAAERVSGWAGRYINLSDLDVRGAVLRWIEQFSRWLLSWGAHIVTNVISFVGQAIVVFFTLFFLLREGGTLKSHIASLIPLKPEQVERLFTGISNSIVANVYGCLAVGISQGSLTTLAFWVLGLPSPVLWGVLTALFSLIPVIGSAAIWGPAVVSLLIGGHWWKAMILLGWGVAIIGQIDSVVRPYVISERSKMHTLLVFFALLGGVKAFGAMGIFIGPVILSITLVILEMLREANSDSDVVPQGEILSNKEE